MSSLSHNLVGQRIGRKGRDTRERILAATERLLTDPEERPISLSAVAREASLAMTTLYIYFNDLTELLLAVLGPITASAEDAYVAQLRDSWPDDALGKECERFVDSYHEFWLRHSRILHLRNSFADNGDERMWRHRIESSWPLIELLVRQMKGDPASGSSPTSALATVLVTGVERVVTMVTNQTIMQSDVKRPAQVKRPGGHSEHARRLLQAEARLLELGITEGRRVSTASI